MINKNSLRRIGLITILAGLIDISITNTGTPIENNYNPSQGVYELFQIPDDQIKLNKLDTNIYIDNVYERLEVPDLINKPFIESIINIESGGYPYSVSSAGARGLMQVTQRAWEEVEKEDNFNDSSFDPSKNIKVGIKYLIWLHNYCEKNNMEWNELSNKEKKVIIAAAYNGGIHRLKENKWDVKKMPTETKKYINKVHTN